MAFCVHCDQKEQCFSVSSRKQSTGVHQRVDVFRVCPSFLYTCAGFLPELLGTHRHNAGGHRSRGFCFSFLSFFYIFIPPPNPPLSPPQPPWLASWVQAATGNSPDVQPESKQRTAGVVSCKTSPAVPLISRDRERGGRGVQMKGRQPDADHAGWGRPRWSEHVEVCVGVGVSLARRCTSQYRNFSQESKCAHRVTTTRIPASFWWGKITTHMDSAAAPPTKQPSFKRNLSTCLANSPFAFYPDTRCMSRNIPLNCQRLIQGSIM